MIALDTSALVAVVLGEPEAGLFNQIIAVRQAVVGAPTLVEAHMVLASRSAESALLLDELVAGPSISVIAFDARMSEVAKLAFTRFGKGRGHPAQLNYGDCLSYAVAKVRALPLLFKCQDFSRTDLVSAIPDTV